MTVMTIAERPAPTTTEWQLSRYNLNQIDDQIDGDGVYAKGYWEDVDGHPTVTGLRIGGRYTGHRLVAKFGDFIIRHANGTYTVRSATPEQAAAFRRKDSLLAEQAHDMDSLDNALAVAPPDYGPEVA